MNEEHIEKVKENVTKNVKKLREVVDAFRSGMGIPQRIKWRDRIGDFQTQRLRPQEGRQRDSRGIPAPPKVQERFAQRPRLLDFIMKSQDPQQPQFTEEEKIILQEREVQLREDAERRAKEEQQKKESTEKAESLKRARENMSVENL